jgi:flagellar assembly factor FliW
MSPENVLSARSVIETTRFGSVSYDEEETFHFPDGLVGFPAHRRYLLRPHGDGPFSWLQSLDDGSLAFPVTEPTKFLPDYAPPLNEEERRRLELEEGEEFRVLTVVSVPEGVGVVRLHLTGPIRINPRRRLGLQSVLAPDDVPSDMTVRVSPCSS